MNSTTKHAATYSYQSCLLAQGTGSGVSLYTKNIIFGHDGSLAN